MAKKDLKWKKLTEILSSRCTAMESEAKLQEPPAAVNAVPVKQEVASTSRSYNSPRSSRFPSRSNSRDRYRDRRERRDSRDRGSYPTSRDHQSRDRYRRNDDRRRDNSREYSHHNYNRYDSRDRGYSRAPYKS